MVKVIPSAKKSEVTEETTDLFGLRHFKVKTTQIAEDGKANQVVIELLAEFFAVKKNRLRIASGLTSRSKIVEISDK